ncbi:DUF2927 domain-containing protein [Winogradskyella sp.]|uniref:DUF2927 domain-containing protein n=1 Tax=Winogradskyella sp. TaxID=1883156 RepID=UPI0026181C9D|nr:DUF2927 domain-containing protein [Winogradskyella sp.]
MEIKNHLSLLSTAIVIVFSCLGCSNEPVGRSNCATVDISNLSETQLLFYDVAFNEEFGDGSERLRKWVGDVNFFIEGNVDSILLEELNSIISELNSTGNSQQLIEVNSQNEADLIVFFGTKEEYVAEIEPQAEGFAEGSRGFTSIFWDNNFRIVAASVCIDNVNFTQFEDLQHVLREELAQSLGLINDTVLDDSSIFNQFIQNQNYSPTDLEFIGQMLSSNLLPGMCPDEALLVF